jgi:hypothetical protein
MGIHSYWLGVDRVHVSFVLCNVRGQRLDQFHNPGSLQIERGD